MRDPLMLELFTERHLPIRPSKDRSSIHFTHRDFLENRKHLLVPLASASIVWAADFKRRLDP